MATFLEAAGHGAVHTTQLLRGNRTADHIVAATADREDRVVITKDRDFWVGHVLDRCPRSLLIVATGSITNPALLELFTAHLDTIVGLLEANDVVELRHDRLIAHSDRKPGSAG